MDWPQVAVMIVTYRRLRLALETIRSIKEMLDYPNLSFHIADDGSGKEYTDHLVAEIGPAYTISVTDSCRGGIGRNMNLGIESALKQSDIWFQTQDDYILKFRLDLKPCVQLLLENQDIGMVRLGWLNAGVEGKVVDKILRPWLQLKRGSDNYVYNDNPHLTHRRFYEAYGQYSEILNPGDTENEYCGRFNKGMGPEIVWPCWLASPICDHIGASQSFNILQMAGKTAEEAATVFEEMDKEKV